ncbi:MAG TPA: hypothetical protein VEM76_01360 [Anaeromyxobacteraceae bacterium]|nr:hypothetical protein [Anaeromyxobacteraceae bacterium]
MPGTAPPPRLVAVTDDALPRTLFSRLAGAVRALGTERLRDTYQTTFWFDFGRPAALPEEAILALRGRLPAPARRRVTGVEWWLSRMRTSDVRVDFHRDRDTALFARTGATVHPACSSVLYLGRCRGGLLAVTGAPPDEAHPACAPDPLDADLVRPWPNRLVLFPGDATHGVLDAHNAVPTGRLPEATPLRLALVMNWWRRRPEGVRAFARSTRYPALRLPRRVQRANSTPRHAPTC